MLRLVVLTTLVVGIFLLSAPPTSYADDPPPFRATTRAEFPQTRTQQQTSKEDSKVSSIIQGVLQNLQDTSITQSSAQTAEYSSLSVDGVVRVNESGEIHSYIYTTSTDQNTLQELEALGARIELTNHQHAIVQAWIPFDKLEAIADLSFVRGIRPPGYAVTRSGSVTTEGDSILKSDLVRNLHGITGAGVKIGVISDGVDSWEDARDSGDLPSNIEIHPAQPGSGDEGTAMLEIIHDIAPDASLAFSGGLTGTGMEMIESINYLANDAFGGTGADIIVDDLGFFDQPYFEDGPIAQAVQDVVAGGTIYLAAAGNHAQVHYEADFVPGPPGDFEDFHEFSPGDQGLEVLVPPFGTILVVLQWNDEFGNSGNDYDLFVCEPLDVTLLDCDFSVDEQNGSGFPIEMALYQNISLSFEVVNIFIQKFSGSNRRLEAFILGDVLTTEYSTAQGSIFGHAAVDGAIAVGAIDAADPGNDDIEFFSSQGPSEVFFPSFESRPKPDVTAIDGVSVTGAGGFSNPFFGTSAAAPHAAAVAALVLEAIRIDQPEISKVNAADLVFSTLQDTAVDLGAADFDNVFGAGRLDALAAVDTLAVSDVAPPLLTIESITTPLSPLLLAGKDMETEVVLRADEDLNSAPVVTVTFVNAPPGSVHSGIIDDPATGGQLSADVQEIGTNRWRVAIDEPSNTGYYNIYIQGEDQQGNVGDVGIEPSAIKDSFFQSDGTVNTSDAIFFEADITMPDPLVRIAGELGKDDPVVAFQSPFLIEISFDRNDEDTGVVPSENSEYEGDSFGDVTITRFELDGVDLTDILSTTDNRVFQLAIENILIGEHELQIQAVDEAGNMLDQDLMLTFTVIPFVDLMITKDASSDLVSVGDALTYLFTVENNGTATSTDVILTDDLPDSVAFDAASSPGICNEPAESVVCSLGDLGPGAMATTTITVLVKPTQDATIDNTATVAGDEPDANPGDNTATEVTSIRTVDLKLDMTASANSITVNEQLTYSFEITNLDESATSTNVKLIDSLPANVSNVSFTAPGGSCSLSSGTVTCEWAVLGAGEMATSTIVVVPTASGSISNQASVTGDQPDSNPADNDAVLSTTVNGVVTPSSGGSGGGGGGGGGGGVSARPVIAFSPELLMFTAVKGQEDPEAQELKVFTSRSRSVLRFTVSADAGWLRVTPTDGISDDPGDKERLAVSVNTSGLDAGTYIGTITLSAGRASNDPQTVPVTLIIEPPPQPGVISVSRTMVEPGASEEITTADGGMRLAIPATALPSIFGNVEVEVKELDAEVVSVSPQDMVLVRAIEVNTLIDGQATPVDFEGPVELSFLLTTDDIEMVDGDTGRLGVLWYNPETEEWAPIPAEYDPEPAPSGRLVARLDHFSIYALSASESPTEEATPSPLETANTPTPSATPVPTATPTAAATPTVVPTAQPTAAAAVPAVKGIEPPSHTPTPTAAAVVSAATATPTPAPTPTITATPTAAPALAQAAAPGASIREAASTPASASDAIEDSEDRGRPSTVLVMIIGLVVIAVITGGVIATQRNSRQGGRDAQ